MVGSCSEAPGRLTGGGLMREVDHPGVSGSMPISFRGMIFAGTAPQAWFQSWFGLYLLSQASIAMVLPARIMLYQLRSCCEVSSDNPYSASPPSYTASIR